MIDATRTTTALLDGLCDPENDAVWSEFDKRYRAILVGFAKRLGSSDADAADVAQETLMQFVKEYREGKYDRDRARLRSWLMGIAKYRVAGIHRKRATRKEYRGDSAMMNVQDEAELSQVWDDERREVILQKALIELRQKTKTSDKTIEAFERHVLNGVPVTTVAEELEITAQEVYLAKSRVTQRLREIVTRLDASYDAEL